MGTFLYSCLHFLVDFLCAFGMFRFFTGDADAPLNFLIYNFCAFVLQLPLGAVLDRLGGRKTPLLFAGAGCALTLVGAFTGPVLLGEVSQCNDDACDNRFNPPMGRFPAIEEDEAPYRLLCTEYPAAKD